MSQNEPAKISGIAYSDYPEVDIQAHRKNARVTKWIGYAGALVGIAATWYTGEVPYIIGGIGFALICMVVEAELRLQAVEWELELIQREESE